MCVEDGFCHGARLEERKAQQHGVAHAGPDGLADVLVHSDILHEHSIDRDADDNEKRLKAERQQAAQIIFTALAPLLVHHGRHRDWCNRGREIDLDHASIDDDKDADRQHPHGRADEKALEPQAKERPDVHGRELCLQVRRDGGHVDGRA